MDKKTWFNYMLSTNDSFYIQNHRQVESGRPEKDIPYKQQPKENRGSNTNIKQNIKQSYPTLSKNLF